VLTRGAVAVMPSFPTTARTSVGRLVSSSHTHKPSMMTKGRVTRLNGGPKWT
jgi:hypothetical protein